MKLLIHSTDGYTKATSTDYWLCNTRGLWNPCFIHCVIYIIKVSHLGSPNYMIWPKFINLVWSYALNFRHISLRNYKRLKNVFIVSWMTDLQKPCSLYEINFGTKCYPKHISTPKFRIALFKMRSGSYDLEVERGRYVRLKLNINERLFISCHVIEDEEHFVTDCVNNREIRKSFFDKILLRELGFANWANREKIVFLMFCEDPQILTWLSIFYHSFNTRNLGTSLRV